MKYKVLIPQDVSDEGKNYLLERGYEIKMGSGTTEDILKEEVQDCDAVLARSEKYSAETLRAGKKLKVIARHGVGYNNIDLKAATELGIYVTIAPLSNAISVAEHSLALILALSKNLLVQDHELRKGNFEIRNQLKGNDLEGKTLGLIGLGRIGSILARKAARGLDMKIIGYDPYIHPDSLIPEIELVNDWETIFKNADYVSLHLPYTPENKGIIGMNVFKQMKKTACLINAARGELVNEGELAQALQEGIIAGAGLDVFDPEPPSTEHPLLQLNNVIVTPHNAALTVEAMQRMSLHAAMCIDEVLSGKKPSWPVNMVG